MIMANKNKYKTKQMLNTTKRASTHTKKEMKKGKILNTNKNINQMTMKAMIELRKLRYMIE